jgi:hypothetical protein
MHDRSEVWKLYFTVEFISVIEASRVGFRLHISVIEALMYCIPNILTTIYHMHVYHDDVYHVVYHRVYQHL